MSRARNPTAFSKALEFLNQDFCPGLNRYVYWLKQPVGWFVLATLGSVLVGTFTSPVGWTMASGLVAILIFGLAFPWLAVHLVRCELAPAVAEVRERDAVVLELTIRNRLPTPVLGLTIEGYLSAPSNMDEDEKSDPDIGLSRLPPLSMAVYQFQVRPEYRGIYPIERPRIACSFPFGIWTARSELHRVVPLIVRPLLIPITGMLEFSGNQLANVGEGTRPTCHGEFLGVRDFRHGDSLKNIHWAQSARHGTWIVCERGGPQQQALDLRLSTARSQGTRLEARENLAWRVRIAASFVDLLVARQIPFLLWIDGQLISLPHGNAGGRTALNHLAAIPHDGARDGVDHWETIERGASSIHVGVQDDVKRPLPCHLVPLSIAHPMRGFREPQAALSRHIDLDHDIAGQMDQLLSEACHAKSVA